MKQRIHFEVEGLRLIGDLFIPAGEGPHPAVIVVGPMTSVKEQVTGVYAAALAVRGVAALCFDHRYYGESAGEPRQYEQYAHKIMDIMGAIGWLSSHRLVDADRIGLVGVCLGCGYAAHAAVKSPRVKALGFIAGYYRDPALIRSRDVEDFDRKVEQGRRARQRYEETGEVELIPAAALDGDAAMTLADTFDYYASPRASVPNYRNAFAVMSREFFLPFDVQQVAAQITQPVCMVHSQGALSPALAQRFYTHLAGPKQIEWLHASCQVNFYDSVDLVIPAATLIAEHLHRTL
jgi:dienelactone hydrolase